jgi:hypothetical protein
MVKRSEGERSREQWKKGGEGGGRKKNTHRACTLTHTHTSTDVGLMGGCSEAEAIGDLVWSLRIEHSFFCWGAVFCFFCFAFVVPGFGSDSIWVGVGYG